MTRLPATYVVTIAWSVWIKGTPLENNKMDTTQIYWKRHALAKFRVLQSIVSNLSLHFFNTVHPSIWTKQSRDAHKLPTSYNKINASSTSPITNVNTGLIDAPQLDTPQLDRFINPVSTLTNQLTNQPIPKACLKGQHWVHFQPTTNPAPGRLTSCNIKNPLQTRRTGTK